MVPWRQAPPGILLLEAQPGFPPPPHQTARHLFRQRQRRLLLKRSLLEDREGGEDFAVDILRFEEGEHLAGQLGDG